jgi:hemerythrin-like metal-binding protein
MIDHPSDSVPQIGIAGLDFDHSFEDDLLRALHTLAHSEQETEDTLRDIIHQFIEHMVVHNDAEELLMKLYAYPGATAHRRIHATMLAKARELLETLEVGGRHALPPAVQSFYTWLINHVKVEDTRLGIYLSRLGAVEADPVRPKVSA